MSHIDENRMSMYACCLSDIDFYKFIHLVKFSIPAKNYDSDNNQRQNKQQQQQQEQSFVVWPCLKLELTDISRVVKDKSLFNADAARQITIELVECIQKEIFKSSQSICLLLGDTTPSNVRIVYKFSSLDHKPIEDCTLFRFTYTSFVTTICTNIDTVQGNIPLQNVLHFVSSKLDKLLDPSGMMMMIQPSPVQTPAIGNAAVTTTAEAAASPSYAGMTTCTAMNTENVIVSNRLTTTVPNLTTYTNSHTVVDHDNPNELPKESVEAQIVKNQHSLDSVQRRLLTSPELDNYTEESSIFHDDSPSASSITSTQDEALEHKKQSVPTIGTKRQLSFQENKVCDAKKNKRNNYNSNSFSRKISISAFGGNFEIPGFDEVRSILTKAGYKICKPSKPGTTWKFYLPNDLPIHNSSSREGHNYFTNENEFRCFLCANGLDIDKKLLTTNEVSLIEKWVRGSIIKSYKTSQYSDKVTARNLSAKEVLAILRELGFKYSHNHLGWILPNTNEKKNEIVEGHTMFPVDKTMFQYLARFGIPTDSNYENVKDVYENFSDLLSLELFLARDVEMDIFAKKNTEHLPDDASLSGSTVRSLRSRSSVTKRNDKVQRTTTTSSSVETTPDTQEDNRSMSDSATSRSFRSQATNKSKNRAKHTMVKEQTTDQSRTTRLKTQTDAKTNASQDTHGDDSATQVTIESTGNLQEPMQTKAGGSNLSNNSFERNKSSSGAEKYEENNYDTESKQMYVSLLNENNIPVSFPSFSGSDETVLKGCLENLQLSYNCNNPTVDLETGTSKFASNLDEIMNFLQRSIDVKGTDSNKISVSSRQGAMYVCGIPGVGKTSGVKMCCTKIQDYCQRESLPVPAVCFMNAAHVAVKTQPMEYFLDEIGNALNMTTNIVTIQRIKKKLRVQSVILVIDEVDVLVTSKRQIVDGIKLPGTEGLLQTFLELANDHETKIVLIGISNCINNDKYDRIRELGSFHKQVTFSAYSEDELFHILEARVGTSVIAKPALAFIAKRVAKATGDARKAIEGAAAAVKYCLDKVPNSEQKTDGPIVTIGHYLSGTNEVYLILKTRIGGLPLFMKIALCILISLAERSVKSTKLGTLQSFTNDCLVYCGYKDEYTALEDYVALIATLAENGLLLVNKNFSNQMTISMLKQQVICLRVQLTEVVTVLEKELSPATFDKIREFVKNNQNNI